MVKKWGIKPKKDVVRSKNNVFSFTFFHNLSMKTKLTSIFSFLLVFTILIGIAGFTGLQYSKSKIDQMYSKQLMSMKPLYRINATMSNIQSIATVVLYDNKGTNVFDGLVTGIKMQESYNAQYFKDYEAFEVTGEEAKMYANVKEKIDGYTKKKEEFYKAAKANTAEAKELFTMLGMHKDAIDRDMTKLLDYKEKQAATLKDQLANSVQTLSITILILEILLFLLAMSIAFLFSNSLVKQLKDILSFTEALGQNDLTQKIESKGTDELGKVATSLNIAQQNMQMLLQRISRSSQLMSDNGQQLSATMQQVNATIENVFSATEHMTAGTEYVSNATENVRELTLDLADKAGELKEKSNQSYKISGEIQRRASEVETKGLRSIQHANEIYEAKYKNITTALQQAEVVDQIKTMTEVISKIAEETHLLAINAMIESAKAGEHGRTFVIVAQEIRKLSQQSNETVEGIRKTIKQIQSAVNNLSYHTKDILQFVDGTVKNDYEFFLGVGHQYKQDAAYVADISKEVADYSQQMSQSLNKMNEMVQILRDNTEENASGTEEIYASMTETTAAMTTVSESASEQAQLSYELAQSIQLFKL